VPKRFNVKGVKDVLRLLDDGYKLFIKVRFGSMGKGITYLEKGRWMTNFRFRKGKIVSKKSDYILFQYFTQEFLISSDLDKAPTII
jgi:glutathione synthase/RimK-type ligase-like ATP-grasp enzyme